MNIFIVVFFCGLLYNVYKFYNNKQDIKFLNEYLNNSLELYQILLREQEDNKKIFYFLSHNSVRFDKLVPAKVNFPYTNVWIIEFMLNNFNSLYNNAYGVERKLVFNTKHGIINTIESRIGDLEQERKKILFRFFPLFFVSNFFDFCITLFSEMFSIDTRGTFRKCISFATDVAGILGTIAVFSDEFITIVREIFVSIF